MSYRLPSTLLFKPSTFKLSLPSHSSITPFNKLFSTAKTLSSKQSHPSTFTSSTNYFIKRPLDFKNSNRFQSRCFSNQSSALVSSGSKIFQQKNYKQLFITSASVIGSLVLIDGFLNRDQRSEALSITERELLNSTFTHTGVGLTITALLAKTMFKNGVTARMMSMNPLMVMGLGLAGSIGTMFCTLRTSPDNTIPKYAFWLAFNACQAATLSPLYFYSPVLLSKAALYTLGIVGSLSYVGATAKTNQYLYMGGPLLAGVSVVALSSLAPLVLPVTAARTLMATEAISLYGGLAVFSGFVLYDTQKILHHAQLVQAGQMKADPVNESVGLIMDSINIFIRLVQILATQSNRK